MSFIRLYFFACVTMKQGSHKFGGAVAEGKWRTSEARRTMVVRENGM